MANVNSLNSLKYNWLIRKLECCTVSTPSLVNAARNKGAEPGTFGR